MAIYSSYPVLVRRNFVACHHVSLGNYAVLQVEKFGTLGYRPYTTRDSEVDWENFSPVQLYPFVSSNDLVLSFSFVHICSVKKVSHFKLRK